MKFSKDELRLVARSKGWTGGRASKDDVLTWLNNKGVDFTEIGRIVQTMRRSASGQQQGSTSAVSSGIGRSEVEQMIRASAGNVDMDAVRKLINDAVAQAKPYRIVLDGAADKKPVELKHRTHPQFEKVLRLVRAGVNVLLVGPAGCGKTTLAHHIAIALKRKYGTLHCTAGASESQLTGWLLPIGKNGAFEYVPSEFVSLYEEGDSLFLLDEIDAADPNMLLVANSALANGALHVPQRYSNPHVPRGKNNAIMAAANTFGTGADVMYAGRNQLDAATLDRFYVVEMGYDKALEAELVGSTPQSSQPWQPSPTPDASELEALGTWINDIRVKVTQQRLRRVISTRTIQKAMAARKAGIPSQEIRKDLLAGWTRDELVKVGAV